MKLIRALVILLDKPYVSNGRDRQHEKLIRNTLRNFGFHEVLSSQLTPEQKQKIVEHKDNIDFNGLPQNFFIWEPINSNSSPDFFIQEGSIQVHLEAKACKKNRPVWNSIKIHKNTFYLFSNSKGTCFFNGNFYDSNQLKKFRLVTKKMDQIARTLNEEYNLTQLRYSPRPRIIDMHPDYLDEKKMKRVTKKTLKRLKKRYD